MKPTDLQKYIFFILAFILLATLGLRFAEPITDGDFFWHAKYGQYMIENHTLIPDHTIYSWTPADGQAVKCNWIADILLYLMHQAGGLPLLFVFRYICLFLTISIILVMARQMGEGKTILTLLVVLIFLLSSLGGARLKTEIFSMCFFSFMAGIYFSVKASLWKKWGGKLFLFFPILFLFWVNIHEVFLFGMVILGLITVGEILNYRFSPKSALSKQDLRHLLIGLALSFAATFVTPYGYLIHQKYYDRLFTVGENIGFKIVTAYFSIFDSSSRTYSLEMWFTMLISLVAIYIFYCWKKKTWDWAIFLSGFFLAVISAKFVRCVYFWPPFWAMGFIYLLSRVRPHLPKLRSVAIVFNFFIVCIFLFFAFRAMYDARYRPFSGRWLGFGISDFNPVQESRFLKEYRPGTLLFNSYNAGGYLIYDLYPIYKVFCDPRYFPYRDWFSEYYDFNYGDMPLKAFMEKYDFDVVLVDYVASSSPILKFLKSPEWEPVFYGVSGMVFVRKDVGFHYDIRRADKHRFDCLRNLSQATMVFFFAQNIGDLETSRYILQLIRGRFSYMPKYEKKVQECSLYQEGLEAYEKKDYQTAFDKLNGFNNRTFTPRANFTILQLRNWKAKQLIMKGDYREALKMIEANLRNHPQYVDGLYNAGLLSYQIETHEKDGYNNTVPSELVDPRRVLIQSKKNWQRYLERFLSLAPDHRYAQIARGLLEGKGLPLDVPLSL